MKAEMVKTLVNGQKLFISYKGIRPCTFKNSKGGKSFVWFDEGDGQGVRLRYVFSSLLLSADDPKVIAAGYGKKPKAKKTTTKKATKTTEKKATKTVKAVAEPTPKAELPREIAQAYEALKALKTLIEMNGYEVTME